MPLSFVAAHGLKMIGAYCVGYIGYKAMPKRENFPRLMRMTFIRTGLVVKVDAGKKTREEAPKLMSFERKEWGFVFKYRIVTGQSIAQFIAKADEIGAAFNGEANIYGVGSELTIEVLRKPLPSLEYWSVDKIRDKAEGQAIPIPVGYTRKGIEVIDLAYAPHGAVGGQSGAGKSVFVRSVLTTLATLRTPKELTMTLIDLKHGVELSMFSRLPHVTGFAKRRSELGEVLGAVKAMVEERAELFEQAGVTKIAEYNKTHKPLPYHIVLVDELAELDKPALEYIDYFARIARFTGVHMLLATQRPDRDVMPGGIKANIPLTIAFKCKNEVNSRILLDNGNAAKLPPIKGRCIVQYDGERQSQALLIDEDVAKEVIKPLEVDEKPTPKKREESNVEADREGHRDNVVYI